MADFSEEQMEDIREEFIRDNPGGKYIDSFGNTLEGMSALQEFIQANRQRFVEKFAQEKAERLKEEEDKSELEKEAAEKELDVYLQSVYVEEKGTKQDITKDTWNSPEYIKWRDNYEKNHPQDSRYQELKAQVDSFQKNINLFDSKEVKKLSLSELQSLNNNINEATDNSADQKSFEDIYARVNKIAVDFLNDKVKIEDAAFENENFAKLQEYMKSFSDYSRNPEDNQQRKVELKLNELRKQFLANKASSANRTGNEQKLDNVSPVATEEVVITNENQLFEEFGAMVANYGYANTDAARNKEVQEFLEKKNAFLAKLDKENRTRIEGELTDRLNNNQSKTFYEGGVYVVSDELRERYSKLDGQSNEGLHGISEDNTLDNKNLTGHANEQTVYRERSANSDSNDFLLDRVKLQVLLEMKIIDQALYDTGIKNPAHAIEVLNSKRPLNDKEQAQFEDNVTGYMLNDEQLFVLLPPSILAKKHKEFNLRLQSALQQDPQADVRLEQGVLTKLEGRMDGLSADFYERKNLFFADVTNISDTYDGYMEMFAVREQTLSDTAEDNTKRQRIDSNRKTLQEIIASYDNEWNLQSVSEQDAERLNHRFNDLSQALEQTTLNEETLSLVSNFKFLDAEGKPEPQFVSADGQQSDNWQSGSRIIEGSKLENMVRIARQNVLMENLGSADEISAEKLNAALSEQLPEVLYAAHVANQLEQGIKEDPRQFTDRKYLNQFVADLRNIEKPMKVSPTAYEASVDNCINSVGAYAHRLGSKIGKDKPVVAKLFEPLKDLDKRAADRTTTTVDKRAVRVEMLSRTAKMGASAFLVSGAITVAATATAADASLTAATLGMNKYAGMAVGSALAVGLTIRQIRRWRKERKEAGEKRGLKALVKDRRMMMTIGTTALGAAAVGFAATGNPGVAQALGYSAMALGTANGVINSYQDVTKAGLSGWEAAGWAALQAGVTIGAGFTGRWAANQGINLYNQHNPENDIFQHKSTSEVERLVPITETQQIADVEQINNNAQEFLSRNWYSQNPEQLAQLVEQYGSAENLLYIIDAGGIHTPGGELMIDGTISDGNHTVLTHSWAEQNGVSSDSIDVLRHPDAHTPEQIQAAVSEIRGHVDTERNFVGRIENAPTEHRLYAGRDPESTYSHDNSVPMREQEVTKFVTKTEEISGMVRNETDSGLGMFGVLGRKIRGIKQLKERAGAFADKLFGKKKNEEPVPPSKIEDEKWTEGKKLLPEHTETSIEMLLDKEYKIVHADVPNASERKRYRALVQKEMQTDAMGTSNLAEYLQKRMSNFEQTLATNVSPHDEAKGFVDTEKGQKHINETRETMWKTNLTADGKKLESKDVTLLHFEKLAGIGKNNAEHANLKAAEDRGRAPSAKGKNNRPHGGSYNVIVHAKSSGR